MTYRDRIESLLRHYVKTVWTEAGLTWDSDHDAEIASLADDIDMMVKDAVEKAEWRVDDKLAALKRDLEGEIKNLWDAIQQTDNGTGR